ncbi:hypothetical protein BN946_scf184999.g39 [Trametes cinnabarina]|uniref:UBC core domain-containing protein n=1 Tax=Pycnoporus cinnabarinus TaxID=5643 RepID=A0A060SDQ6_PYCCI|nr:hypothetical protein BN946_scf184999.g39 [Trametes cinnabarina]
MASRAGSATALRRLMTEYKQLTSQGAPDGMFTAGPISESDFFTWEALIVGPKDTPFEGGVFPAILTFRPLPLFRSSLLPSIPILPHDTYPHGGHLPWTCTLLHTNGSGRQPSDYPLSPFKMKFDPPLFHPNIYPDGTVCISILHTPGDDPLQYEQASERWSPVQSVEKVILSVISMLAEPNLESGANIDCCKLYRENRAEYERIVRQSIREQLGL